MWHVIHADPQILFFRRMPVFTSYSVSSVTQDAQLHKSNLVSRYASLIYFLFAYYIVYRLGWYIVWVLFLPNFSILCNTKISWKVAAIWGLTTTNDQFNIINQIIQFKALHVYFSCVKIAWALWFNLIINCSTYPQKYCI